MKSRQLLRKCFFHLKNMKVYWVKSGVSKDCSCFYTSKASATVMVSFLVSVKERFQIFFLFFRIFQNAAAHLLTNTCKRNHITPVLSITSLDTKLFLEFILKLWPLFWELFRVKPPLKPHIPAWTLRSRWDGACQGGTCCTA